MSRRCWRLLCLCLLPVALPVSIPEAWSQAPELDERGDAGESLPPVSRYYEARITSEGYAIYVPLFISRREDSAERGAGALAIPGGSDELTTATHPALRVTPDARTREEIVPGEFIQIYRPAVYEIDEDGQERLIEAESTVTLPKVRILLERVDDEGPPLRTGRGNPASRPPGGAGESRGVSPD